MCFVSLHNRLTETNKIASKRQREGSYEEKKNGLTGKKKEVMEKHVALKDAQKDAKHNKEFFRAMREHGSR